MSDEPEAFTRELAQHYLDEATIRAEKAEAERDALGAALADLVRFVGRRMPHQRWQDEPEMAAARALLPGDPKP